MRARLRIRFNEDWSMSAMNRKLRSFFADENGATAVEYALFAAAVSGVIVAIVFSMGGTVDGLFKKSSTEFDKAFVQKASG